MYQTLAELRDAVARARTERAEELPYLVVDNDEASVYQDGGKVFSMHPAQVLEEALDLLGIPHEEP